MPVVPKLDRVVELRFYRQSGMSASTIYARREFRMVEYSPRSGRIPTRLERVRYVVHANAEIDEALTEADTPAPVRIYDNGLEYQVNAIEETRHRDRVLLTCSAFPPSQR